MLGPARSAGWRARVVAADRASLRALATTQRSPTAWRLWRAVTHLGGVRATALACGGPLLVPGAVHRAAVGATAVFVVTQALVHATKRLVRRPRPSRTTAIRARAIEPDPFSFPSGHSAGAMAVALGYSAAMPAAAPFLVLLALVVGLSRAVLGVHYLLDVAGGLLIAIVAAGVVHAVAPTVLAALW